jgi:hypothetical protein
MTITPPDEAQQLVVPRGQAGEIVDFSGSRWFSVLGDEKERWFYARFRHYDGIRAISEWVDGIQPKLVPCTIRQAIRNMHPTLRLALIPVFVEFCIAALLFLVCSVLFVVTVVDLALGFDYDPDFSAVTDGLTAEVFYLFIVGFSLWPLVALLTNRPWVLVVFAIWQMIGIAGGLIMAGLSGEVVPGAAISLGFTIQLGVALGSFALLKQAWVCGYSAVRYALIIGGSVLLGMLYSANIERLLATSISFAIALATLVVVVHTYCTVRYLRSR